MPLRQTSAADYQRRLLRTQQYLQQRLDDPIDPAALAQVAHFSLHHFHRIFRAQMGETVMEHVRRLRLERAARKLRNTQLRLLDLALEAGYESHEAFTRAFSARFGVTPSQFREQGSARLAAWQERRAAAVPVAPLGVIKVVACPALRVAFMRHRGSYGNVGATWQKLVAWAQRHRLLGAQPTLYGVCPDDPDVTAEPLLRFDACVVVGAEFQPDQDVAIAEIAAGSYAVGVHHGPYESLADTYLDVIGRWFPGSGHEPAADAVVEHYLNDPSCAAPADLRTEVRVRLSE